MRAQIRHVTEYHYPDPAFDSFNELRLQPAQTSFQSLLGFQIRLEPDVPFSTHTDYYGTTVHHVHIRDAHTALRVETNAIVVTHPRPQPRPVFASLLEASRAALYEYLVPSKHVPVGVWATRLEYRDLREDDELLEYLLGLNARIKSRFSYETGVTSIGTPLEDFVMQGAGVCQDFTHLMLAVCREQRIPARYVSGYVYAGRDFLGAAATHAWVECYVPESGWVGFDPTNNVLTGEAHVRIGCGRDYDDVAPMRGVRRGGGVERLGVEVSVRAQEQ
jgi:transglutaminase-like putative cysteine protease